MFSFSIVACLLILFPFLVFVSNKRPNGQNFLPRISGIPRSTPALAASAWLPISNDAGARRVSGGRARRFPRHAGVLKRRAATSDKVAPDPSRNGRRPRDARGCGAASDRPERRRCDSTIVDN